MDLNDLKDRRPKHTMTEKNSAMAKQSNKANRGTPHGLLNRVPQQDCRGQDKVAQRATEWLKNGVWNHWELLYCPSRRSPMVTAGELNFHISVFKRIE